MTVELGKGKYGAKIVSSAAGVNQIHWFEKKADRDKFIKDKQKRFNELEASITKLNK